MTLAAFSKLLAIFLVVAIGWWVGRRRWLDDSAGGQSPTRILSNAAFYLFVPALLFRTTARVDFAGLPWHTLNAFFLPVQILLMAVYGWHRTRTQPGEPAALPSVRAITATFGNTLQVGVPMAAAMFGETGLSLHITVVSLHALTLLTVLTLLVELDLAHAQGRTPGKRRPPLWPTLATTVRNTVIHPVVLPVLTGMLWNALGLRLPGVLDEALLLLGSAVVPVCLTLIGLSLAHYGWPGEWKGVSVSVALKLMAQPALVLAVAHWGFGLQGQPLSVLVMMGALPVGSNALIFAQRYQCAESDTTSAIVLSTLLFAITAPCWLWVLAAIG